MLAQQLLTDTYTQHGLLHVAYDIVQSPFSKICHSVTCLSLTRKNNPVGRQQFLSVVRPQRINTKTLHGIDNREDITCIIFYYCNFHCFLRVRIHRRTHDDTGRKITKLF